MAERDCAPDALTEERGRLAPWLGEPASPSAGARTGAPGERARLRGEALLREGDSAGALRAFDEAARLEPDDPWTPLSRAAARYQGGDLEGAARDAAEFGRRRPGSPAALAVEALLAASRGDASAAGAAADRLCARAGGAAWARALRGTLKGRWGDLDGARADLDAALGEETLPWALAARADALNRLGFFWLALEDLDRLRALLPEDPEPDALAAAIHRDQAQYADAVRRLSRAEALAPGQARWPRLKAEVAFVQGRLGAAAREIERALRLSPRDPSLHHERVRLLALAGREREGERALKKAPLPAGHRAHLLGYLRARRGRWKEAERLFRAAAKGCEPLRERSRLYAAFARERARLKPVPREGARELRLMGLGYRQPFQTSVEALAMLAGCEIIYSNLSDAQVVDFIGLLGKPFRAIVFRRSDQEAFRCARDVMPAFKSARVVGVVTRGHPLYYGRLAYRLWQLVSRKGWRMRVPGSPSLTDAFLSLAGMSPAAAQGLQVRDCNELGALDPRVPLVLYNFGATGDWRAELPRKLMASYPGSHPAFLLAGSGSREFEPKACTLATLEPELRLADEAVTLLLPAVEPSERSERYQGTHAARGAA